MTKSEKNDPSTLILKMIGGTLDGKLLPVTTQKCFLSGGDNKDSGQCTIIRGPSGTALRAVNTVVYVNGKPDSVHWLKDGDAIAIGQMRMVVQQLGYYPQTAAKPVENSEQTKSVAADAKKPTETANQVKHKTPQLAGTTTASEVAPERKNETASKPEALGDGSNDVVNDKADLQSKPAPKTSDELSAVDQKANEARLERALQSLAGFDKDSTPEETTEKLVEQRLDDLENELDSHEKSYSEPMPVQPTSSDTPKTDSPSTKVNEDAEPAAKVETNTTAKHEVGDESMQTAGTFETTTVESTQNALPPLTTPVADSEEQATESPVDTPSNDLEVSDEEQAQLDDIIQRLGMASSEKTEEEVEDASASETSDTPKTDSPSTKVNEDAEPAAKVETNTTAKHEVGDESMQTADTFETTAESARDALPPLTIPVADSEEQAAESPVDSPSNDLEVSDEEQAQLNDIMQRLGMASGEKTEEEVEDASASEKTPHRQFAPTILAQESETSESETSESVVTEAETAEAETPEAEIEASTQEFADEPKAEEVPEQPAPAGEQQSVAEILARMKSEGKLDQFESPEGDNIASETPQPEAAPAPTSEAETVQPQPEPASEADPQQPAEEEEEDASVQDYMDQLFNRLRGDETEPEATTSESAKEKPKPVATTPAPQPEEAPSPKPTTPEPPTKVMEPSEYVPKQKAPEVKTDIQALRQLANKQKTNAVSKSHKAKSKLEQAIVSYVAGGAFAGTLAFGWIAKSFFDPAGILASICFVVSIVALSRYLSNKKKMKELN